MTLTTNPVDAAPSKVVPPEGRWQTVGPELGAVQVVGTEIARPRWGVALARKL